MPYKISKPQPDRRINTCGFLLPDGFYRVEEMTFDNTEHFESIKKRYRVEEIKDAATGLYYEATDERVDEDSVRAWVAHDGPLLRFDGTEIGTEAPTLDKTREELAADLEARREQAEQQDREAIIERLTTLGVNFNPRARTSTLRDILNEALTALEDAG